MLNLVNTWESEACGRTVLPDKTKWQKFKIQMTHFIENHIKSRIQNYERSELRLQFEWTKCSIL